MSSCIERHCDCCGKVSDVEDFTMVENLCDACINRDGFSTDEQQKKMQIIVANLLTLLRP